MNCLPQKHKGSRQPLSNDTPFRFPARNENFFCQLLTVLMEAISFLLCWLKVLPLPRAAYIWKTCTFYPRRIQNSLGLAEAFIETILQPDFSLHPISSLSFPKYSSLTILLPPDAHQGIFHVESDRQQPLKASTDPLHHHDQDII